MNALIVDASVAIKWFVAEEDSALAEALLARSVDFHAPALMRTELCNGLWKNWRKGLIGEEHAFDALAKVSRTFARWHPVEPLLRRSLENSFAMDHPVYDLCYLSLAETTGYPIVTADERFMAKVAQSALADRVLSLRSLA